MDCQIESMSITDITPIKELVLNDNEEICSAMLNKVEFIPHQSDCFDYAYQQIKVSCESASVVTQGSRCGLNNPWVLSIKSHQGSDTCAPSCAFATSGIKLMSFSGRKYQINPVTFVPGDMAMWRYANDILKAVLIQSVCPPSCLLP